MNFIVKILVFYYHKENYYYIIVSYRIEWTQIINIKK